MIYITNVVRQEKGAVILAYCRECHRATFLFSEQACWPENGDLWKMEACPDVPAHNMPRLSPFEGGMRGQDASRCISTWRKD